MRILRKDSVMISVVPTAPIEYPGGTSIAEAFSRISPETVPAKASEATNDFRQGYLEIHYSG